MDGVSMIVNMGEIYAMTREPWAREEMQRRGEMVANRARAQAPHRTGAGGASIIAEPVIAPLVGWTCDIGWDHRHTYMRYTDRGTKYIRAQYYMERALEQGV